MKKMSSSDSFGVIGLGRFGTALAECLSGAGKEVIAIDMNESRVREARKYTDYAFVAENIDRESLEETGVQNCGTVIVCIGEQLDQSILTTMLAADMGIPHIISKAASQVHGAVLRKIGAEVVYPERDMALRIGKKLISGNFRDFVSLDNNFEVRRLPASKKLTGRSIREIGARQRYGINIIAIERGCSTDVEFSSDFCFMEGDVITVIGKTDKINKFESDIQSSD